MTPPFKQVRIANALLWASAVVAAAILQAPLFLTIVLLPLLGVASMTSIESLRRQSVPVIQRR